MLEQFTKFANVRVEDIPAGFSYCVRDGWSVAYRSPEKIKSLNGQMEYHYIHEWTMHARTRRFLIREEYFGAKVEWTKYEIANGSVCLMESSSGKNMKTIVENEGKVSLTYVSLDSDIDAAEKQSQQSGNKIVSADEKLDEIIDRLDVLEVKLLAKFPGEYRLDADYSPADDGGTPLRYFGAEPDKETSVNPWVVKMPDEKNPGRAIPFYVGDYLHAEAVTGERIIVDGEEYLIMQDNLKRRYRVSRKTQIVHLMEYEKIELYVLPVAVDGWTVSDGKVAIYGTNEERTVLPNGTKFKVVEYVDAINWGEIVPGTLAIRYPDYKYPTL